MQRRVERLLTALRTYAEDLDEAAVSTALIALKELVEHGESETLRRCWWLDYRRQPPAPEQILDDPAFLGNVSVYPFWREEILHVIDPVNGINEHLLGGSLGIGKTYVAAIEQYAKIVYLSHLRDPATYYGLARESRIIVGVFSVTLGQTKNGYGDFRKMLHQSAYIQSQFPFNKRITQFIEFIRYPIEVIVGSQELSALGGNLFGLILDEANFRLSRDPESSRGAHKLYGALSRRIMSRFGGNYPGLLNLISSARDQSDFLERHLSSVRGNPRVHYTRGAIWDVRKPKSNRRFFVYAGSAYKKPHIVQKGDRARYREDDLVSVPLDYYGAFRDDCDGSLRDLAGIPTFGSEKFIRNRESIKAMYLRAEREGMRHPFNEHTVTIGLKDKHEISDFTSPERFCVVRDGRWTPMRDPMCPRVIHIDTAFTQDGLGLAMGYVPGVVTVKRGHPGDETPTRLDVPSVIYDFVLRVVSPPNDEVPLFKIRNFIAWLSLHGFNIQRITADGYNCFTGDTRVRLLDGTVCTMKDLADRYGRDEEFWVYSYDEASRQIVPGRARNARKTKRARVWHVELDNGSVVRCTEDHRWLTRDGRYVHARDLTPGTSLMPLYTRVSSRGQASMAGYEQIMQPGKRGGTWVYTHRVVASAVYGVPSGMSVHHKDANRRNNRPDNLDVITNADHLEHHRPDDPLFGREGYWTSERRTKQAETVRALHDDPEYHRNAVRNLIPGQTPPPEANRRFGEMAARMSHERRGEIHYKYRHDVTPELVVSTALEFPSATQRHLGELLGVSQDVIADRLDKAGIGHGHGWRKRLPNHNHCVVSVVETGEVEDVYDIEVDQYHNFALDAGVFVHNSRDNSQLLREGGYNTEVVSIDKTDVPYVVLREALKEERILLYYHPIWDREILNLEYDIKKRKIDHPAGGNRDVSSKDVSDATAGVAFTLQDEKLWKAPDSAVASSSGPRPLTQPNNKVVVARVGRIAGTSFSASHKGGFHVADYEG